MWIDTPEERSFVLECVCREKLVVLGREEDWRSRNPIFRCDCGESLSLAGKDAGEEEFLDAG